MNKAIANTIVLARLLLACLLLVVRWAVFEPLFFAGLLLNTIGDTGRGILTGAVSSIRESNNKTLLP